MLAKSDVIGFVPTMDGERARRFYVETLNLELVEDDGFAVVVKAHGTMIRIVRLEKYTPATYTILGWEVADISRVAATLAEAGIDFLRFSYLDQDATGIWTAPSGSKVAWFNDPDGNVLSISQS